MYAQKEMSAYQAQLKQVHCMPQQEREVLAERLKAELAEFKERERMYTQKRRELQELEMKYRKKQDELVAREGKFKGKLDTNEQIIDHLIQQIEEARAILANQQTNNGDLEQKIET